MGNNLALHKPVYQSSVYIDSKQAYDASRAVDGSLATFFHTNNESNPWWEVDLGRIYTLSDAVIYNRQDCCQYRERTLLVLLSNDGINWKQVYDNVKDNDGKDFGLDGKPLDVNLKGEQARFVRLQLKEKIYFNLAEVEIYGSAGISRPVVPKTSLNLSH